MTRRGRNHAVIYILDEFFASFNHTEQWGELTLDV